MSAKALTRPGYVGNLYACYARWSDETGVVSQARTVGVEMATGA